MQPSRARPSRGLLAVLVVALLLPVVALASRPEDGGSGLRLGVEPARVLLDVGVYVFAVLAALGVLLVVWALWPRRDDELPALPPRRRHGVLSTVLGMVLLVAIAVWMRSTGRLGPRQGLIAGGGGAVPAPALAGPGRGGAGMAGFDWLAAGIVLALVAAAAVAVWWLLRRRAPGRALSPARLRAVLDDAIEDVLGEKDPRRAVIATWTGLERVLAVHNLARRDAEAPFEYASRAGAELAARLGVERGWLEQLAGLFEWARFSTHEVTPAMREEALGGLVSVRDGLRVAT